MKTAQKTMKSRLLDLWVTAFEGGSGYWAETRIKFSDERTDPHSERAFETMWNRKKAFRVWDAETGEVLGTISKKGMIKGYSLLKREHPKHYGSILSESWDANTADVWLQLAVLGEITFS